MWYIERAMQEFPYVNFRYIIEPTMSLPGQTIPLNFNHDDLVKCIDDGYKDAEAVINATGTKGNAREAISNWRATRDYQL